MSPIDGPTQFRGRNFTPGPVGLEGQEGQVRPEGQVRLEGRNGRNGRSFAGGTGPFAETVGPPGRRSRNFLSRGGRADAAAYFQRTFEDG